MHHYSTTHSVQRLPQWMSIVKKLTTKSRSVHLGNWWRFAPCLYVTWFGIKQLEETSHGSEHNVNQTVLFEVRGMYYYETKVIFAQYSPILTVQPMTYILTIWIPAYWSWRIAHKSCGEGLSAILSESVCRHAQIREIHIVWCAPQLSVCYIKKEHSQGMSILHAGVESTRDLLTVWNRNSNPFWRVSQSLMC